ncbi:hypothetical protein ACN95_14505 [Gordonia sihwensis]|nr:hypothetical protein [Gordonia sihwensis]
MQRARQALDGIGVRHWYYVDSIEWENGRVEHNVTDGGGYNVAACSGGTIEDEAEREQQAIRNASFIAAAPDLVRKLAAEVEKLRAQPVELSAQLLADAAGWEAVAEEHADTIGKVDAEVEKLCATVDRVQKLAERWEADPCVCGYRIPDGNDTDSQCLHCGATSLLRALDGEAGRG